MGKKYKKKVQWKQLSLNDLITTDTEKEVVYDCEEEGDSAPHTPTHETPYQRHPYKPNFNNPRRGPHHNQHNGYYHANYDRRFEKQFDRYHNEQFRNLENRGGPPFDKPYNKPFYDRNYHHDKFYGRPPFYGDRNFRFAGGFVERGRRPFRPYGRPGFFPPRGFQGPFRDGPGRGINGCEGEEEEGEWDDEGILVTEGQQQMGEGFGGGDRPSQPVHTVMINNEEYTKIQTPRQEVIFKKSSLDRKRDSIDQGSVTGSMTSGSGSSSSTGGEPGSGSAGSGDQVAGDGSSVAGSVEDTSLSMTGDDLSEGQHQNQVYDDPNEIFAGEPGGPPLAGVVMQQAYPGGPMIAIPVHWTPFIDPGLIPGETALTPLDPAFTHVIDPKALPIDPLHIIPVQHDASGCPVHVQVKVDSNGVPVQIQPTAFTVSLSSIHQQQQEQQQQQQQQGVLSQQEQAQQQQQQQHQQQHQHHQQEQPQHQQHLQDGHQQCSTELHRQEGDKTVDGRLREEQVEVDSEEHRPAGERPVPDGEQTAGSCRLSRQSSEEKKEVREDLEGSKEHEGHEQHVDAEEKKKKEEEEEEEKNDVDEVTDKPRLSECEGEEVEEKKANREQEEETVEEEKRKQEVVEEKREQEEMEEKREVEEEKREHEDVKEEAKRKMEKEEVEEKREKGEEIMKQEEEESGEGEIVEVKGEVENTEEENRAQDVEEAEKEKTSGEVVKEEEGEVRKQCIGDEGEEESNKETLKVDPLQKTPTATTPEVPVPNPDVRETTNSITSSSSSPAVDARERGGSEEQQTPQEEEEEEEEEDMLAKESEEGSESSDSQYASMSESSSTPTTPACEPSYSHETTENQREACKDTPEADSAHTAPTSGSATDETAPCEVEVVAGTETSANKIEASETSRTSETSETNKPPGTEEETTGDSTTTPQPPDATESTENVLQGYVMVPILTPYYDPSVLYGYPVVVPEQHQHQHQRGYSKRKKKKYHRRRHADVPAAGGYLDPQLYTGEPFVATPGGYVVPIEAATSVCQVHGFQYVTPAFHPQHHQQHLDEGYAHSPYLPTIVLDPAINQEQYIAGTNLDDASRTIFGDLQEKERRQIQEILHEQRAKVGKSDSTESSDSGVSESEEAVAAELSSDEQDAHKNDQEASTSCVNTEEEEENLTKDSLNSAQCNDESPEPIVSSEEDSKSLQNVSQGSIEGEENSNLNVKVQEIVDEPLNAQCELPGDTCVQDHVILTNVSDDDQQNQLISTHDASIQQDSGLIERCPESNPVNDTVTDTALSEETLQDQQDRQVSCSTDKSDEEYQCCETSINNLSEDNEPSCVTLVDTPKELSANQNDLGSASEFDVTVKTQVTTNSADNDNTVQSQTQTVTSGTKELPIQQEYAQENSAVSSKQILDQSTCQRINSPSTEECTDDSSIDRECFKDLKVTEAVKRWIREVTPEKAFLFSEVHTLLLEQDIQEDIQEEMDTEDEYIEDELPQTTQSTTIRSSKNAEGNPFVAASSDASTMGMESCSKRVAVSIRNRGTTPDTLDDYDGSSTISNLSYDHLYSEASSSQPASFNHSFDEEVDKYTENPSIYNPVIYAKYYQLGVEVDDTTPTATPLPQNCQVPQETTPVLPTGSENVSECGSEDVETVPHKYDVVCQYTATSPMSLATEILKAEKVLSNMTHITGSQHMITSENRFGNPDIYLKHYGIGPRMEVGDSGVQSEESSDEMEARSNVGSSGVGSSLASTPAVSPAHRVPGRPFQQHPLKNLTAGDGPVPCRTACCAVM